MRENSTDNSPQSPREEATERTVGMTPEQEQEYLQDQRTQPQPADGGIGAMTDMQGREPDTSN